MTVLNNFLYEFCVAAVLDVRAKKCELNELMKEVRKSYILDCLDGLWLNPTNADKNYFPAACCVTFFFDTSLFAAK